MSITAQTEFDQCRVVAWGDWPSRTADLLTDLYHRQFKRELFLSWTAYYGGGALYSKVLEAQAHGGADVVVGDREILLALMYSGFLRPLGNEEISAASLKSQYASWLRPFGLSYGQHLVSLPIRWGTTSLLVKKRLFSFGVTPADMSPVLEQAQSFLIWSPHRYFLYPMGVLASSVNPVTPLSLAQAEFDGLRRRLDMIARKRSVIKSHIPDFAEAMRDYDADVVVCPGDWILNPLKVGQREQRDHFDQIANKYDLVFPCQGKTIAFFESVGIMAGSQNLTVAHRVVSLLVSQTLRQELEKSALADPYAFASNPTVANTDVLGPGFQTITVEQLLDQCIPRSLPTDHTLRPTLRDWRDSWKAFQSAASGDQED